jgi:hypothetical protein
MIPSLVFEETSSPAERHVFDLLQEVVLGPDTVAYHSLNLANHEYKLLGELDFVVLSPRGVLVLEVKGGGVQRRGGVFVYTDRYGTEHRSSEGPFKQARSGMFSLKRRLTDRFGAEIRDLSFGYAAVFPDTSFPFESVEWDPEMVIDRAKTRTSRALGKALDAAYVSWQAKSGHGAPAPVRLVERIGKMLRPDFDKVPSVHEQASRLTASMEHLTDEQYRLLDAIEDAERVLCQGGAGTGKTFLGIETARRHAEAGSTVMFVCRSPILAARLGHRIGHQGAQVVSFDDLVSHEQVDVLVVDEGQDLLSVDCLAQLDRVVRGGLADGCWRFFYDANNQGNLDGSFDSETLDLLKSMGATPLSLRRNCRNTPEIVLQTQLLTGADIGVPIAGHGPPVEFQYSVDAVDEAERLGQWITRLLEDDVQPSVITLLSGAKRLEDSSANLVDQSLRQRIISIDSSREPRPGEIEWANAVEFKGLENDFIAMIDVLAPVDDPYATRSLYVGLSRARVALWVSVRELDRAAFEQAMALNMSLIENANP